MHEPTETEIEKYRQERLRAYLAGDWNEAFQEADDETLREFGRLMVELCTADKTSRSDALQFSDRFTGAMYARMLAYWMPIVEREVEEWISDYPARAAITAGEREYDARKDMDDTITNIALQR